MAARPEWTTACVDWEDRIVRGQSMVPPPLFPDQAAKALAVFKALTIVDAPWLVDAVTGDSRPPTFGEACEAWVFDFVAAIFGAYDEATGRQLINEFFLLISKKNAKSTIAAGIMVTALVLNWRMSAELLMLAPSKEGADNCFTPARDMVQHDPSLRDLLDVREYVREIEHRLTKSVLKVVAADSDVVGGKKAAFVLIDELWSFGKRPKADGMFREATGGLASRPEGFVVYLSTHADEEPAGIFKQKLTYFRAVRDGEIAAPKSLGLLYEFPPAMLAADAFLDPANFYVTNPNLGRSVDHQWLVDELVKEQQPGGQLQVFLAKHLNVEIGLRLNRDRWPGAAFWEQACDASLTLEEIKRRSEVCVAGIDGGGLDDLFGLTVMGREKGSRRWLSWSRGWAQRQLLTDRPEIAPKLLEFERDGDLVLFDLQPNEDGELAQDFAEVVAILKDLKDAGLLPKAHAIGLDPAGVATLIDALIDGGLEQEQLTAVTQGYRLQSAIKAGERKLKDRTWRPAKQGLMAWCVGNAKVEKRGNAVIITKQVSGSAKIDPLMSSFNAGDLMAKNPEPARKRSYQMMVV